MTNKPKKYVKASTEERIKIHNKQALAIEKSNKKNGISNCVLSTSANVHCSYLSVFFYNKNRVITLPVAKKLVKATRKMKRPLKLSDLGY